MKTDLLSPTNITTRVLEFVDNCKESSCGAYRMWENGHVTLYSSCFAVMLYHYFNVLSQIIELERNEWIAYMSQFQDPQSGLFVGPEIDPKELNQAYHDYDHVTRHLTAHVLPALHLLGGKPPYPLYFAHCFMDQKYLLQWLQEIDWRDAWLRGNDLLFVGQFLIYLRDFEKEGDAQAALDLYFQWLDSQFDPNTGLWGTNGYCDAYQAFYGAYHQLLVYYFCEHNLPYASRTIDTLLSLQHPDGSFTIHGGGGACEDVDGVDILVNMYKYTGYRQRAVCAALSRILKLVLSNHMPDGGFVYRKGIPFTHMGMNKTSSPPNHSNLFATWFRVHTIALCCQLLIDHPLAQYNWQFNTTCSMGWHGKESRVEKVFNPWYDRLPVQTYMIANNFKTNRIIRKCNSLWNRLKRRMKF